MSRKLLIIGLFCFANANYELDEGEPCVSEGLRGTCRLIRYCATVLLVDIKKYKPKHPPICSFLGKEPVVCCTDCEPVDATKIVVTIDGVRFKLGTNKPYNHCLDRTSRLPCPCRAGAGLGVVKALDEGRQCHYLQVRRRSELAGARAAELAERGPFPHLVRS